MNLCLDFRQRDAGKLDLLGVFNALSVAVFPLRLHLCVHYVLLEGQGRCVMELDAAADDDEHAQRAVPHEVVLRNPHHTHDAVATLDMMLSAPATVPGSHAQKVAESLVFAAHIFRLLNSGPHATFRMTSLVVRIAGARISPPARVARHRQYAMRQRRRPMNPALTLSFMITLTLVAGCGTRGGPQAAGARSRTLPASAATPPTAAAPLAEQSPIPRPGPGFSLVPDPDAIAAVKERGARTAAADIKVGKLRILEYGASHASSDAQTGLPTFPVPCCDMTGQVSAEADAYNQVMRDWHAKHLDSR